MHTVFRLVGYVKANEGLGLAFALPHDKVADVLAIVHAKVDDPDVDFGDWELTQEQAAQICLIIGWPLDADTLFSYDFFLEPQVFADEVSAL